MGNDKLKQLCSEIRAYMVECCSENPGHLGSSLGAVEIAVALHKVLDTPRDKIIWDVGHQAYAHKILTGRREAFRQNRKRGGISGFPRIDESPYDAFGAGHASNSISAALGMSEAFRLQGLPNKVVAVIGDGALTGGLAFEGLDNAGSLKPDMLVILNDNQISIDKNTSALHNHLLRISTNKHYNSLKKSVWDKLGTRKSRELIQKVVKGAKHILGKTVEERLSLFDSLGLRYFGPVDGNDIAVLTNTLKRIVNLPGPKILHVITVKGKGYAPAEENQTVWHAPGKFDVTTGKRAARKSEAARFQDVFGEVLLDLARRRKDIVGITPAMATGCGMTALAAEFPERTFDVGIAEGHAVTFSAGLAAQGLLPFCNIYSTFSQRAYDNIIHDVALQNLKVIFCFDRAGLVGEDGATHHGAFDLAAYRSIPNLTICAPRNELELKNMMYSATLPEYGPTIIRYPRGCGNGTPWRKVPYSEIKPGKAVLLHEGGGTAVLSIGAVGNKVSEAVGKAAAEGIDVLHYDMRFLKPVDREAIADACSRAERIITVENGVVAGGLHGAVAEYIADNGLGNRLIGLGIPDRFIGQGTPDELCSECGFNTDDILRCIVAK
ncbi:MAG: 1-deoxy-D-xylulose-5-phosphate synthase [Bacteroidales bacterium]|nr:1-deoxy-D-xylulose-5-phosphate synthase [Candidatus Cacconaster equifaecalis]